MSANLQAARDYFVPEQRADKVLAASVAWLKNSAARVEQLWARITAAAVPAEPLHAPGVSSELERMSRHVQTDLGLLPDTIGRRFRYAYAAESESVQAIRTRLILLWPELQR